MLKDQLQNDLKEAMRAKDAVRLRSIRSLRAALMEREIELRTGGSASLTEEQEQAVVQKQAKQRRDAAAQYRTAGRTDLEAIEVEELAVLEQYLPKQLTDDELRTLVLRIVQETGATSMKDMGRVMGAAIQAVQGRADGKRIQGLVRELIA